MTGICAFLQNIINKNHQMSQYVHPASEFYPLYVETISVPQSVRDAAQQGLELLSRGFKGGTETGWKRAKQLANGSVTLGDLANMRAWFARHGPDAKNGGTSYPGYCKWMQAGAPLNVSNFNNYRGAVAWLIWGGSPAYMWLKSEPIRELLELTFPDRKASETEIKLNCL